MSAADPSSGREQDASQPRSSVLAAVMRDSEEVTPLELFFDLVFVLALTQCTTLLANTPTWEGMLKSLLVLGMLWWSWVGYAWLTSAINPEEGAVRLVMFAAMAAFLVCALCVPGAFGSEALLFACSYAVVRASQIALYLLASREDADLRRSVVGLACSSAIAVALLFVAAACSGWLQVGVWGLALVLDAAGPYLFGAEGWKLVPGHFAERHGAILIIALGESVVAVGVGARPHLSANVVVAAVLGVAIAAALWWVYFDVAAIMARRRLEAAPAGRERNELARDNYSYMHFPMVAGIALIAVGIKFMIEHPGSSLALVPAAALLGGGGAYLLALTAFRLRAMGTLAGRRLVGGVLLLALIPAGTALPPLLTLALLAAVLAGVVAYEALRFARSRDVIRHRLAHEPVAQAAPGAAGADAARGISTPGSR